ncbi:hypothetical protein JW824_08050 [bacterium]|nr:hypothetical protein [bacterium]
MMKWHLKTCVLVLSLALQTVTAQDIPDREIHYRYGDWISYPVMRYIHSIVLGPQYIYFGTTGGISRYHFFKNAWEFPFTVSDGLENGYVHVLAYDFNSGILWCATDVGLSYWVTGVDERRNISYQSLNVNTITSIGIGDEYVWLESSGRILRGDRFGFYFRNATEEESIADQVRWSGDLAKKSEEQLPELFMEAGYLFHSNGTILDRELREYAITDFYQDDFNRLWLATWGLGGGVADVKTDYLTLLPFGPYISDVKAMAWDGWGMWLGGHHPSLETGGITWWDMENGEWIYFEARYLSQLKSDEVNSIAVSDDDVWFGTMEGLGRYDKKNGTWRNYTVYDNLWDNRVNSVILDNGGKNIWVGTTWGINRIRLPNMTVEQIRDERLIRRTIYQLVVDGNDVWAGTDRGLYRYDNKDKVWEYIPGYPGMLIQKVTAISVFKNEIWFGTDDGVQVYDKQTGEWIGYPADHDSIDRTIHCILADSGAVWVGTDRGVLKYHKKENRWRRFTTDDGLIDNVVNWILLDGDYVWFGTGGGLTRFYWNAPYRKD